MNKEILIVDDEKEIRELCKDILQGEDYNVALAGDAEEALKKMNDYNFVLFIVDIIMPKIDGLELILKIKQRQPLAVIIVTTGYSSIEGAVRAVHAGAFQYLAKPLNANELVSAVSKGLEFHNFLYGPLSETIEPVKEIDEMRGILLFKDLSEKSKTKIYSVSKRISFEKSDSLDINLGKGFFVISEGELSVWYNNTSIEYLTKGDTWGEEEILGENSIFTNLRAESDIELLFFKLDKILEILKENNELELFKSNITKSIYYKWIKSAQRIAMLKLVNTNNIIKI